MDVTPRRIPFIGLHLDVSRAEAFPSSPSVARPIHLSGERSVLEILFHLAPPNAKYYVHQQYPHAAHRLPFRRFSPLIKEERYIATFIDQVAPHRR